MNATRLKSKLVFGLAIVSVLAFHSCSKYEASNQWSPKTKLLDECAQSDPKMSDMVRDVKLFYENLHNKRWSETYKQRSQPFQNDITEDMYIRIAKESSWELVEYEVLPPVRTYPSSVVLICKFVEGPLLHTSYNSVTWTLEGGKWKCDSAGPNRLSIFYPTRLQK